jgi:hypothetical protein
LGFRKKTQSAVVVLVMRSTQGFDCVRLAASQHRDIVTRSPSSRAGARREDAHA